MDLGEAPTAVVVDPGVGGGRPTDSASTGPPEVVPLGEMNPDRPRSSAGLAVVVVATLLAALAALWVATTEFGAPQRTEKIMSGDGPLSASKQAEPAERAVEKQVVSLPEKKSEQGALNPRPRFSTFLGFRPGSTFAAAKRILGTADMWAKDGEPDVGESIIASFFSGEVDFKNAPYGHLHLKVSLGAKPFLERRGFVDERLDYLGASEEAILGAMAPPFEEQDGDRYYRIKAASKKIEVIHNGIDGFRVRATLHIGYNGRCKMIELVWTTG
jgi:hypothetical protein